MSRRLAIAIAGVATVAVLLFAVPLAISLGRSQRTGDLVRLERDTFAATRQIDLSDNPADAVELPRSTDRLTVYDGRGGRVTGSGPADAPTVVLRALRSGRPEEASGTGPLVVALPLVERERVVGAVLARRGEGEASGDAKEQRLVLAGLALAIIAAAVLAAVWLGRALARPLEHVAVAATRLGYGDFSVRAPASGVPEVDAVGTALATTAGRLEDLIDRERSFSADASHQLRTPLQALRIELESAELRGDAPPEVAGGLAQVDRLEDTIATLLAVARDHPRREATVDLAAALDEVRTRWHGRLAATSRPLVIDAPEGLAPAAADPRIVTEILDVLVDNAHRHGAGAVTVAVRDREGWLAIDVSDEGPGFRDDPQSAFRRRERTGNGHGIGLALARSLTQAEGGRLSITHPDVGPVVTLVLRRAPPAPEAS